MFYSKFISCLGKCTWIKIFYVFPRDKKLVETLRRSHGGLDVQRPNVLPVFLKERDQEVHGQVDVLDQLLVSHANVADSDAQAQDL